MQETARNNPAAPAGHLVTQLSARIPWRTVRTCGSVQEVQATLPWKATIELGSHPWQECTCKATFYHKTHRRRDDINSMLN